MVRGVAVCCRVLQCVAVDLKTESKRTGALSVELIGCVAVCRDVLRCAACVAGCCDMLQ